MESKEMMTYVDNEENKNFERVKLKHPYIIPHKCQRVIILRYLLV